MARTPGSVADETRRRIIGAASLLFAERGYAGTSIRDIALELGMTKAALYYHFVSKDALLLVVAQPVLEAMEAYAVEALAAGRVEAELIERLVDALDEHALLVRRLLGDPSVGRVIQTHGLLPGIQALFLSSDPDDGEARLAAMRARCAAAVIQAGVIGSTYDAEENCAAPSPGRLTDQEKSFLTRAALAVLTVPELAS